MNFAALSKEQKQKLILGVIAGVAAIYGIYTFALVPVFSTMRESRDKLVELKDNLEKADAAQRNHMKVQQELQDSADDLYALKDRYLPSIGNELTWATEVIYDQGRKLGIEVESVTPVSSSGIPWAKDATMDRVFEPYIVRIATICTYFELVDMINSITHDNPYACVKSVIINKLDNEKTGSLGLQNVTFQVEWPMWRNAEAVELIRAPRKRTRSANP
ncbi:MAG: hypothetical protein EOM20_12995 [Spartobacteria bacterium]|nr:hypothetical protein [Spartobacteria bacterium]